MHPSVRVLESTAVSSGSWCPGASKSNQTQTQSTTCTNLSPNRTAKCLCLLFLWIWRQEIVNHPSELLTLMHAHIKDCRNADTFTGQGIYTLKICMWQFFRKEPEEVQIRHVARNGLQNLVLRPHSFILKLCQTSGGLFTWEVGLFCYLTPAAGCARERALVYGGRILCERLQG